MGRKPTSKTVTTSSILSPRERRERDRKEMRTTVLDVAQEIMREEGVNGLTLQRLAAAVKVQPPSLYEYFDGKNGVYDALYVRGVEHLQSIVLPALSPEKPFAEQCASVIHGISTFARRFPELYTLVFENPVAGFEPSAEARSYVEGGVKAGLDVVRARLDFEKLQLPIADNDVLLLIEVIAHGVASRTLAERLLVADESAVEKTVTKALVTLFMASAGKSVSAD